MSLNGGKTKAHNLNEIMQKAKLYLGRLQFASDQLMAKSPPVLKLHLPLIDGQKILS